MIENELYIEFKKLKKYNVINAYTKRPLDFTHYKITEEEFHERLNIVANKLQHKFRKAVYTLQSHTSNVAIIDETNINDSFEDVDGLITNLKNVALLINTADCQSIFIYDKKEKVIANIHSGWRGTVQRILTKTILLMKEKYNCNPKNFIVCFCPSILKCCFEVDEDVKETFRNEFKDIKVSRFIQKKNDKYFIDTIGINTKILKQHGVKGKNIITSNICTKCNRDEYHSYRGNIETHGHNLSLIALADDE